MKNKKCKMYPFLKAVRGNWHNALFIKCDYDVCPHSQAPPCEGFLLTIDADGTPILMPVRILQQSSGESIEPEECRAVLNKQAFEAVYSLYIEWHTVSSIGCPLLELCKISGENSCL